MFMRVWDMRGKAEIGKAESRDLKRETWNWGIGLRTEVRGQRRIRPRLRDET
jgi:hypothetical protein